MCRGMSEPCASSNCAVPPIARKRRPAASREGCSGLHPVTSTIACRSCAAHAALARGLHQLRSHAQVRHGELDVSMAHEGRQDRQPSLDVHTIAIPLNQARDRVGMTNIVQACASIAMCRLQPGSAKYFAQQAASVLDAVVSRWFGVPEERRGRALWGAKPSARINVASQCLDQRCGHRQYA